MIIVIRLVGVTADTIGRVAEINRAEVNSSNNNVLDRVDSYSDVFHMTLIWYQSRFNHLKHNYLFSSEV